MSDRVFVVLDLETTGLNYERDAITEVAAVRVQGGQIVDRFSTLVNPRRPIPLQIQQLTGIRDEDVANAPVIEAVAPELLSFVGPEVAAVVAHNTRFDMGFLGAAGIQFHRPALDTFELAAILLPGMASYGLGELCSARGIVLDGAHRALEDTEATAKLFVQLLGCALALPHPTLELIAAAGQGGRWPPLMLFEDALRAHGGAVGMPVRTDLSRRLAQMVPVLNSWHETALEAPAPPLKTLDLSLVDQIFGPGGRLSDLLGDQYEERQGQAEMARHVLDTLNQGDHLIIEAGTGVGKSLGYLAPAAFWCHQNDHRVVVATNTIALQDQLLDKEIPQVLALLHAAGMAPVRSALLKGRTNYLCTRRLYEWMSGRQLTESELSVLARVLVWLPTTETGDVAELFLPSSADRAIWQQICSDGATCSPARCTAHAGARDFYLDARRRAEGAHIIVVNHALLVADMVADGHVLPGYEHLIVDEAHRLEEATTDQLTYTVDWSALDQTLSRLRLEDELIAHVRLLALNGNHGRLVEKVDDLPAAARRARRSLQNFAERLRQFARNHESLRSETGYAQRLTLDSRMRVQPEWSEIEIEWDMAADTLRHTTDLLEATVDLMDMGHWQASEPEAQRLAEIMDVRDDLVDALSHLDQIVQRSSHGSADNVVCWLEYAENRRTDEESEAKLIAAPLYIGDRLQELVLGRCRSAIFTGATLRSGPDFRYLRERLGLWDAAAISIASPYDYERNALILMPQNLPQPSQSLYQQAVEQAIVDAAAQAGGRTMVLFTSYSQLRATAASIRSPLDRLDINLLQHGASSRNRLLREYRHAERAVLLGTRTFWEGIDLPGEQLSVLIIVRLPFAVPSDPLIAARGNEFDNAFRDYMLPDAILRFRQGFGRLIRRSTDRGVVILLDSRIWQKSYGQAFLDASPQCTIHRTPLSNLGAEIETWLHG